MDFFWNWIFTKFNIISDNVYFVILFLSVSVAISMFCLQALIRRYTKYKPRVIFGPISMCLSFFIGNVTTNLPVLHPRMNLALSTTAGIIQQSVSYSSNFEAMSNLKIKNNQTIAEFLYNLSDKDQLAWKCIPEDLYQSLFESMRQIRGGFFLPNADVSCFGTMNSMFVIAIILSLSFLLITMTLHKLKKRECVWSIISIIFVMLMCKVSSGAAFGALCSWSMSLFLFYIRDFTHEKEPGSFSAPK